MAPMGSCAVAPDPSPSKLGRGRRWSPSAALRLARQRTPRLHRRGRLPGPCPGGPAATKRVSFSDLLVTTPSSSTVLPRDGPKPFSYPTRRFCMPGTGGAFTDTVLVPSTGTAPEVGPLTSSPPSQGQSSGGALCRAVYTPGDGQTSPAYSRHSVQYLYINKLTSANKPVLSYLLCFLPQYNQFSFVHT
jgi:hypothetical protein